MKNDVKKNLPGLRIYKTVFAVFLCLLIDLLRGVSTVHSSFAAIVCLKGNFNASWDAGKKRFVGTFLSGIMSYIFLKLFQIGLGLNPKSFIYIVLLLAWMLLLMSILKFIGFAESISIAGIVMLIICITDVNMRPLSYAANRVIDTSIGIMIAVIVNWLPFLNKKK